MALRVYRCGACGAEVKTLKKTPVHCEAPMSALLIAPQAKFVEPRDSENRRGRSVMKDQNKILKARAKSHTRDNELNDLIQEHGSPSAKINQWVNQKGVTRKRIDEI